VSIEPPGVDFQQSPLVVTGQNYGAAGVEVENFNRLPLGVQTFNFNNDPAIGSYSPGLIRPPDQFGGAGGNTRYLTVNTALGVAGAPSSTTVTFVNPQRYFGLWWSAGDPNNVLQFFSGSTLLQTFRTSDVTNFIANSPTLTAAQKAAYRGNPNPQFRGQNSGEDYAFLNFFAGPTNPNVTFDRVVLSNSLTTGFESDNHTIAASYTDVTGMEIPPGPGEPDPPVDPGPGEEVDLGPGTVVKEPPGSGVGGTLDIDQGAMVMSMGDKTVDPGGTIEGDGMVMTPDLINNGTVGPMGEEETGTPGDLTVVGNYTQGPTGTLRIGIAGALCPDGSRLVVTGTATLDGTLSLVSLNNAHAISGSHYTVLIAFRGISGFFSNVTDTFDTSGLTRADIATPNGVVVAYLPSGHGAVTLRSAIPIPDNNPCDVDAVLVSAIAPNAEQLSAPFDIWFSLANTQRFNLEARLDDVMAGSTGFVSNVTYAAPPPTGKEVVTGKEIQPTPPSPLRPAPENRWGVWVTGYGDFINVDNDGLAKGYRYTTGGLTVGLDYRLTDHFVVGLMGGYAHTWTDLKPGSVDIDTGWGGLYAGYFNHGFYILTAAFGGRNGVDTSRATVFGDRANGNSDSQELSTFASGGYDFHFGNLTIGPTAAVQYSYVNLDGFTENSSLAALKVHGDSEESWRSDLGFRSWYTFQVRQIGVRPFLRAAWEHMSTRNLRYPLRPVWRTSQPAR
jgi:outer membrane autotransporter protein